MTTSATSSLAPRFSVIVATYNWSSALACALPAIAAQTLSDFEALVVGDGCTDNSGAVVSEMQDERFRWINLDRNHGSQFAPNNRGLAEARGAWIAYCGHDDVWAPDHLERLLAAAEASGARAAVGGLLMYGPPGTGVVEIAGFSPTGRLGTTEFVPPSAIAHRRDVIDEIGPWRDPAESSLPVDCEFLQRLSVLGAPALANQATVFKFSAAARRDSYRWRDVSEQRELLERMQRGEDIRACELPRLLAAFTRGELQVIRYPDVSARRPGEIASFNRRHKGVDPRMSPDAVEALTVPRVFGCECWSAPFEWHAVETSAEGETYRWSGPLPRATIDLPLRLERTALVEVHIVAGVTSEIAESCKVLVNDSAVTARVRPLERGRFLVEFEVGQTDGGALVVTLLTGQTLAPYDRDGFGDCRRLGVAVSRLRIGYQTKS